MKTSAARSLLLASILLCCSLPTEIFADPVADQSLDAEDSSEAAAKDPTFPRFNIGVIYIQANHRGGRNYIRDAYVDQVGIIRATEKIESFDRMMPTIFIVNKCFNTFGRNWFGNMMCWEPTVVGFTVSLNKGGKLNDDGSSYAMGVTYGWQIGEVYIGFVGGYYWDNTIRVLDSGYNLDLPYIFPQPNLRTDGSTEALVSNSTIKVPTRTTTAGFGYFGFGATLNVKFE